jgi:hypothetical protein
MDYRVEAMVENKVVFSEIARNYSHPTQVVKIAVKNMQAKPKLMTIFVSNTIGEVWVFGVEMMRDGYHARIIKHDYIDKDAVHLIMSGNKMILQAIG